MFTFSRTGVFLEAAQGGPIDVLANVTDLPPATSVCVELRYRVGGVFEKKVCGNGPNVALTATLPIAGPYLIRVSLQLPTLPTGATGMAARVASISYQLT